ncbi:TonB family protein [Lutimaribacter sp. EGI FJ00015]|uniref:TonB family protein n=1 Tax=Lutimaribacter degradans TaxID=2945989 RepID=A0ACC5ZUK2_9RHOB|nr:TonB family protein [Lutimaribacter sp. EGI FJ00013]MCM2562024.1 TonB family protein [Lutimaribacter sp. EGI FJ00013]MCO0612944.1 TonB family protein [Lutimaribacter sp. EGI FJ00015]MCO0635856.1 TonB family protein [Lutimaribacter sp. EGI FJ00014]
MMRNAGMAKIAALSVAIIAHGALALALVPQESMQAEGGDGGAEMRLGNAFADMAAGRLSPARPDKAKATRAEAPDRIAAEQATRTPPEKAAATPSAEQADTVSARPPAKAERAAPDAPQMLAAVAPSARQAVPAHQPQAYAASQAKQPIKGAEPDSAAVARSIRPRLRSAAVEKAQRPAPAAKPARKPEQVTKPAARPGNADQNARAGAATGTEKATRRQNGTGGQQQAAGNAAASNYPGLVMRKLSRAGKPSVDARGAAVVAFTIGVNGGLTAVSLARSSGSSALDRAAVHLVRGAGPFPRPPQGARRSFSIQIKGR